MKRFDPKGLPLRNGRDALPHTAEMDLSEVWRGMVDSTGASTRCVQRLLLVRQKAQRLRTSFSQGWSLLGVPAVVQVPRFYVHRKRPGHRSRINLARSAFTSLHSCLLSRSEFSLRTNGRVYQAVVQSILLYEYE